MSDAPKMTIKEFTGLKFEWIGALAVDARIKPAAFKVGVCIIQHVNAETLIAYLSDEVIRDKTNISLPEIKRHRAALRDAGWLSWSRSKTANHYTPLFDMIDSAKDLLILRKEARDDRRSERHGIRAPKIQDSSPVIPEEIEDSSPAILPDSSPVILRDRSPASYIHLQDYTLEVTPSEEVGLPIDQLLGPLLDPAAAKPLLIRLLGEGELEKGLAVAVAIGTHRFDFLRRELAAGRLHVSAVRAARAVVARANLGIAA